MAYCEHGQSARVCQVCELQRQVRGDEGLLRQALEALQYSSEYLDLIGEQLFPKSKKVQPGSTAWHVNRAMVALRKRLERWKT